MEVKADISLWLEFLDNFNGQCFFPEKDWISNETLKLFTDSSGNPELGCGVYFNGLWAQLRWPDLEEFTFDEKYVIPRNGSCGSCYGLLLSRTKIFCFT